MFFLPLRKFTLAHCSPNKAHSLLLCTCLLVFTPAFANMDTATSSATYAEETAEVSISSLIIQSSTLVQEAISSNANASRFRINATLYRESLRSLMISESEKTKTTHTNSNTLFMELVRMSALLQSAAACKTGRFIVCPIELRQQLLSQQKRLQTLSLKKS
ncbi:hypothetical protein MNBD_GAMMA11-3459 [hydrothermal vent metagenome]|uniref:Uncharacterized protein n=1 Tax=hydrothermal vent metagenome TaxID=652676 RepID=A0A3B0YDN2_9ZZZZ